jgi:hypothetical protein
MKSPLFRQARSEPNLGMARQRLAADCFGPVRALEAMPRRRPPDAAKGPLAHAWCDFFTPLYP